MRTVAALLVVCSVLSAADWKIDHATVAGRDLKQMQASLRKVGIDSVYGGAHTNQASEMALTSFPDGSYLELMGIQLRADPIAVRMHEWSNFLREDAGPCAWALRPSDIKAEVARLKGAGIQVSDPTNGGRERPDGVKLAWQTSNIGAGARGGFFPFLIQDQTSREQRVYPQRKPVTREFRGIARVVIAVRNLDDAIKLYRQAYNLPAPIKQVDTEFGAQLALMGSGQVVLAAPLNAQSWLTERLNAFGEAPCAFVLAAKDIAKWKRTSGASKRSRWFGSEIGWLDVRWRLGVEAAR